MDREYSGVIKRKLDDVYRIGGASASVSRGDKAERENRFTFIVSSPLFWAIAAQAADLA
jgi:conserved oligomeric Golgi complex subunit 4